MICDNEKNEMMLLMDLNKLFKDTLRNKSEKVGLKDGYRKILFALKSNDGCNQLDISKNCNLKAPTVCITIRNMEIDGIVEKKVDELDKRNYKIYLTDKGRMILHEVRQMFIETTQEYMSKLSREEILSLRLILEKLLSN